MTHCLRFVLVLALFFELHLAPTLAGEEGSYVLTPTGTPSATPTATPRPAADQRGVGPVAPTITGTAGAGSSNSLARTLAVSTGTLPSLDVCFGGCTPGGGVTVADLVTGVRIALGLSSLETCATFDTSGDGKVTIDELVAAVISALRGCSDVTGPVYDGTETIFPLIRGGDNQFLLPVEVGNQTLNLLIDTGSNSLLVFADRLDPSNVSTNDTGQIEGTVFVTDFAISKRYFSATRSGFLANAPVRVGAYTAPQLQIMVITSPTSRNDPSLTAKRADGIIGLRRTEGLTGSDVLLHAPLRFLEPGVNRMELDLPPTGPASLSFGTMPVLDHANPLNVFKAKTFSFLDPVFPSEESFSDIQVPFAAKSRFGQATGEHLDVLLDTGAVSKLILDTEVAKSLGYNPSTGAWDIPLDSEIDFVLQGPAQVLPIYPKFKVSEISVSPLAETGITFEAVLGISRWQEYVVGFSYVDYTSGGPDGTLSLLRRSDIAESYTGPATNRVAKYRHLTGLNSIGNDRFPSASDNGDIIAFQSDRPGGAGGWDVYVWQKDVGILDLPFANTLSEQGPPSITGDGRYVVYHSEGLTGYDVILYDIVNKTEVELPGLNSEYRERLPDISRDGRYIVFHSDRPDGMGGYDLYLYDRTTSSLVDLPGLNTADDDFSPSLSDNGSLIAFERTYVSGDVGFLVYDRTTATFDPLAEVNSTTTAQLGGSVSPDGRYVTLQRSGRELGIGLHDLDYSLFDLHNRTALMLSGLNTPASEDGMTFSGNSDAVVFHSNRPGGTGGTDIYFYHLTDYELFSVGNDTGQRLPAEDVSLEWQSDTSGLTLSTIDVYNNDFLTLIVDTSVPGLILFADHASIGGNCFAPPTEIVLPQGTLNSPYGTCIQLVIGDHQIPAGVPYIATQAEYNALVGRPDLPAVDGVIGFRGASQNFWTPALSSLEIALAPGGGFSDIQPGFSLGKKPIVDLAKAQGDYVFSVDVDGVVDESDPIQNSYTNMDVPFVAFTNTGRSSAPGARMLLHTVMKDVLILDTTVAESLGYSASAGWGEITSVDFYFQNLTTTIPFLQSWPVAQIAVNDLSASGAQALAGVNLWTSTFILGFYSVPYPDGGPWGTIDLLRVQDAPALDGSAELGARHFVPVPRLNSFADDANPDISDDGQTVVFASNRLFGQGGFDIYVYKIGRGLLTLPNLNSFGEDNFPTVSANGRLLAFQSNRNGNFDLYLYDIESKTFIDLPGLNTVAIERRPDLSADGKRLGFQREIKGSGVDLQMYDLTTKRPVEILGSFINTGADEYAVSLNHDGSMLAFEGEGRDDGKGLPDVYMADTVSRDLIELPDQLNTDSYEQSPSLSADGDFLAVNSWVNPTGDVYVLDRSSGRFIFLPGLNTPFEESMPKLSANAQYVIFQSNRPGGAGGADIYVYEREETDPTTRTVTDPYVEDGIVVDADGNRVANESVNAYDKRGRLLGTATTDSDGKFSLSVPGGAQLPITFEAATPGNRVVTDAVGDDTYVPNFVAGNLSFTEVFVQDRADAGFPATIEFDVEATQPAYNVHVQVDLELGNPEDVRLGENFSPDYRLTALLIDRLGFAGSVTDPIIEADDFTTTEITYYPGTNNKKAHVKHTFRVPAEIPDGLYTAIFGINTYDATSEDDEIQGEAPGGDADNYMVASASTIIGRPDDPNLRILSSKLYTNSLELPAERPVDSVVSEFYDLSLNLEVESMAQDTTLPVDITFQLSINDTLYPLTFADSNGTAKPSKANKQTYPVVCRPEDREGFPEGERCASLYRQEQTGKTYDLYLGGEAYDALATLTSDTTVTLVVTMDPENAIEEYEDNKADNVLRLPVAFLASSDVADALVSAATGGPYSKALFNWKKANSYGNDLFGVGYEVGPKLTYADTVFQSISYPYAVNFDGFNKVTGKVFGEDFTPLRIGPGFDFNAESAEGVKQSYFEYGVFVFEIRIWGARYMMPPDYLEKDEVTLWNTQDEQGNEKYSKSKELTKSKTVMVGYVPLTVEGGVTGELGIRAEIKYETLNKLVAEAGPYASLTGVLEGSVGVPGFQVGVGVELLLIEIALKITPSVQILPAVPVAIIEFQAPIVISTLDGEAYAFVRAFLSELKYAFIEWTGFSWEIHFFPPQSKGFGAVNLFKSKYYANRDFQGTPVDGGFEGILYHDWGTGGPAGLNRTDDFSAVFEGYFNFPGWDRYVWGEEGTSFASQYKFFLDADDDVEVLIDDEELFRGRVDESLELVKIGIHKITVKYRERDGAAKVKLYWVKENQFASWYWNNQTLSGDPVAFDTTEKIDYDWSDKSPKPGVVNADGFSARYQGDFDFPQGGNYQFSTTVDDGVRLWVDNELIIDRWHGQLATSHYATKFLGKGPHTIKVEYFDIDGAASLEVDWALRDAFVGAYYRNTTFQSPPVRVSMDNAYLVDPGLWDFHFKANFGFGSVPEVNQDAFSVIWEGSFYFEEGEYEFAVLRDDLMTVEVGDQIVFSSEKNARADLVTANIPKGWHVVRFSYVELGGRAVADVKWGLKKTNIVTYHVGRAWDADRNITDTGYIDRAEGFNKNWGAGTPPTEWPLPADNFKVVMEGDFDFNAAPYRFEADADDLFWLSLDNVPMGYGSCCSWNNTFQDAVPMNGGTHHVKLAFQENSGNAGVRLQWAQIEKNKFYGTKYDPGRIDIPSLNTSDSSINFNWGRGGPGGKTDGFLIQWVGVIDFPRTGWYEFYGSSDDGTEVFVDNERIGGVGFGGFVFRKDRITEGAHSIKVRFVENSNGAGINLAIR